MTTKSGTIPEEFKAIQMALEALEPLKEPQREFAIAMILARLGRRPFPQPGVSEGGSGGSAGASGGAAAAVGGGAADVSTNVRAFLKQKSPITDLERYLCLAFFMTRYKNASTFSNKEIIKLNGEAGGHDFSNAAVTAGNATRQSKLLSTAGGGKKRITVRGEQLVEALPDRAKVKEITKSRTVRKKAKRRKAKG
jgi:hypothetical protein